MKTALNAQKASIILIVVCGILVVSLIGGGIFAGSQLQKKSVEATHAVIDAEVSEGDTSRLLSLQDYLTQNAGTVDQTAAIVGSIGQYQQNTIIATVGEYARTAGVSVTGFGFGATPAAAAKNEIDVSLGSPVGYRSFLIFLNLLENGVMPVTVTAGTITPDTADTSNVFVTGLKIKVTN